jgi:hypothetical protein
MRRYAGEAEALYAALLRICAADLRRCEAALAA